MSLEFHKGEDVALTPFSFASAAWCSDGERFLGCCHAAESLWFGRLILTSSFTRYFWLSAFLHVLSLIYLFVFLTTMRRVLWVRKGRHRDALGHISSKQWSQSLRPGLLTQKYELISIWLRVLFFLLPFFFFLIEEILVFLGKYSNCRSIKTEKFAPAGATVHSRDSFISSHVFLLSVHLVMYVIS